MGLVAGEAPGTALGQLCRGQRGARSGKRQRREHGLFWAVQSWQGSWGGGGWAMPEGGNNKNKQQGAGEGKEEKGRVRSRCGMSNCGMRALLRGIRSWQRMHMAIRVPAEGGRAQGEGGCRWRRGSSWEHMGLPRIPTRPNDLETHLQQRSGGAGGSMPAPGEATENHQT